MGEARSVKQASLDSTIDLQYLAKPARSQFEFFELALPFLEQSTDSSLAEYVLDYTSLMVSNASMPPKPISASFEVEVVWRTHLLHPQVYAEDCATLLNESGALLNHCPLDVYSYQRSGDVIQSENRKLHTRKRWPTIDLVAAMRC